MPIAEPLAHQGFVHFRVALQGQDFIAPGKGPVFANFAIDEALLTDRRTHTAAGDKYLPELHVDVRDGEGTLVARVHKTLYVRLKPRERQAA